jgi:predicted secreted protein
MSTEPTHAEPLTDKPREKQTEKQNEKNDENRWMTRFEDLLKVKNVDELKNELGRLASEIQSEIQTFDLNAHLSPEAKSRLKMLEQRYANIMRAIQKAQKQFDREFNKSLRVLKRTRQDAEKRLNSIKASIGKHRGTIIKASNDLRKRMSPTPKKSTTVKRTKKILKNKSKTTH